MHIAILISGEPRAIVFKEQIRFFQNLIRSLESQGYTIDIFCMFKLNREGGFIQSEEGLKNFRELLEILNPVHLEFFYEFKNEDRIEYKPRAFYSQIRMIDTLIVKALSLRQYDFFLRIRPDCILNGMLQMKTFDYDTVYSSVKCDAVGNDQMFICHRNMIEKWWIPIIRTSLPYVCDVKPGSTLLPDYFIFYHCPTRQIIQSGLIRDYGKITSWIQYPQDQLVLDDYWFDEESYMKLKDTIHHEEFIKSLGPIISKYEGIIFGIPN